MEKRSLLLAAQCLVSCGLIAQSWCPPGATWVYDTGDPWLDAQKRFTYVNDTTFEGYPAQQIKVMSQMLWQGELIESGPSFKYTRTNGEVVWEWNGQNWDTLYWFSAVPGDSWQPTWAFGVDCPGYDIQVVDTATVIIDGISLRRLWTTLREYGEVIEGGYTFTERIGGYGGGTFPDLPPCGPIVECYCWLSCYRDDEIYANSECSLTVSIDEASNMIPLPSIQPNPGSNFFQLNGLGDRPAHMRILDLQGRLVLKMQQVTDEQQIDVSEFRSGIYLIETNNGIRRQMLRWVKE